MIENEMVYMPLCEGREEDCKDQTEVRRPPIALQAQN